MNLFKSESIFDPYFGVMEVVFDKFTNSFFLDKKIELSGFSNPIILYVETDNKESSQIQRLLYQKIKNQFLKIWESIKEFLVTTKNLLNENSLKSNYRIESITLPKNIDSTKRGWELQLVNIEDGFSKIIIEMEN